MKKIFTLLLLFSQVCLAQKNSVKVSSFTLINAETGLPLRKLVNGSTINLAVDGTKLNIRANTSSANVKNVAFVLSGAQIYTSTDNTNPYALFGDVNGVYNVWTPVVGKYGLKAVPNLAATNTTGTGYKISFTVVSIPVQTNRPPTANAGTDKTITLPTNSVTLTGSGTDPDGNISSYQWTKIAGPTQFTIGSPNSATTSISNLVQGKYSFQLKVTDSLKLTGVDTVNVTVNAVTVSTVNIAPVANAGADKIITLPTNLITLSGSGTDADGTISSYQWTKIAGPSQFTIGSANSASTSITNLVQGQYSFQLKVNDNGGLSDLDTVLVTVNAAVNKAPFANAGADQTISLPTNSVSLNGSGTDPDGTVTSYQWTKIAGPSQFTIGSPGTGVTTITNLAQGQYSFQLKVTDNGGLSGLDTVIVTVNGFLSVNKAPTANAGTDKTITLPANSVTLTGSGTDPDGTIASYLWTKIAGPTQFTIGTATTASTAITNLVQGQYSFQLKVTDNGGLTGFDTVLVTVNPAPNQAPKAKAGTDITITLPANSVTLTGSGTDADGSIASYQWTKIAGPTQFTIGTATVASTSITNLVQGIYSFQLKVTDNGGLSGSDTVVVTVNAATTTSDPTKLGGYFASPTGTGNGTYSSPFKIADFWKIAKAGDTLNLLDGHYTGASSMINPPQNLAGTAAARIVIRAVNDGKADIDGQGQNAPVTLSFNNYFTLEGFNAHNAGSPTSINVSVVTVSYSSYNILRRICAWEAADGNTNIFGCHYGVYNVFEDCAGWGMARKVFSNSQMGNYTTFRRCFGRWEGSHAEGPKKTYGVSYNSYNALLENCIGTWDGLRMQQNYELHDYNNVGDGQFFTNYTVQQPDGIFSHDGFDSVPDIANARLYGCIAYLKASQRYHNSTKLWAAPFAFEIKGIDIQNALSYIEPGSYTNIWNVNLSSVGNTTTNKLNGLTQIGGELGHISTDWTPKNVVSSTTCNGTNTGTVVTKKYIDGVLTTQDLWPWPMNQRIIDAMTQGGYTGDKIIDVNKDIFGLCGNTPPAVDIVAVAKQWLSDSSSRTTTGPVLDSWTGNIDSVITLVKPQPTTTKTGQVFYQSFTNPLFQKRYPNHQFHMYIPTSYTPSKPIGVMVWLHGGGSWDSTEIDHLAIYDMDNEQVTGRSYPRIETDNSNYILIAPIAPFGPVIPTPLHASRWNVPNADQYIMDVINELSTRYNIDYNRIVLAGYSMGGIGAYHMALRLNDRLASVMASAGSWKIASWDGLKNMPMYIISGVNDAHYDATGCRPHYTPIEYARLAHSLLWKSAQIHALNEYPGQHPWDASGYLYWKTFISGQTGWVTGNVRNPYRSNVTAINPWRSYDVGSNYGVNWTENPSPNTMWITIKQFGTGTIQYDYARTEGDGGCSSLAAFNNWAMYGDVMSLPGGKAEANITGPNQITITSTNVTKMSLWLHPKMVDFSKPVTVILDGVSKTYTLKPSLLTALRSYERRWDWGMIYHTEIDIR
ncbi:MAG: hypothetical protein HYR66_16340 [Sphingobacteriales bacterium]|nr:hypothetical protein [Sphingobacteriales bacterium]MBI3718416.1 hypothetical protein [Sphingobacteriales bacterium]